MNKLQKDIISRGTTQKEIIFRIGKQTEILFRPYACAMVG